MESRDHARGVNGFVAAYKEDGPGGEAWEFFTSQPIHYYTRAPCLPLHDSTLCIISESEPGAGQGTRGR